MKFLIIDDNHIMRQTLRKLLTVEGDQVIECDDGNRALLLYQTHRPDWVLMDISIKEVNGIQATERITHADPDARVVIVTDYDDRYFRRAAREAGAIAFISKENLQQIRTVISRE